jgi:hypothetical protein
MSHSAARTYGLLRLIAKTNFVVIRQEGFTKSRCLELEVVTALGVWNKGKRYRINEKNGSWSSQQNHGIRHKPTANTGGVPYCVASATLRHGSCAKLCQSTRR